MHIIIKNHKQQQQNIIEKNEWWMKKLTSEINIKKWKIL